MSVDLLKQMQSDSSGAPTPELLNRLSQLAEQMLNLERSVEMQEEALAQTKANLRRVQEEELPALLMDECRLSEIRLASGPKISVKKVYAGSIKEENRDAAFAWLAEHNHDSLIKNDYTIGFGKGEDDKAQEFEAELTAMEVPFKHKRHVHPQTLNAFIREQVESGSDLPLETFGVFIGRKATIK